VVYVRNDGTVRYRYTNAKQILEMYRILAVGHTSPLDALCDLFDAKTSDGEDMKEFDQLLQAALKSIKTTLTSRSQTQLQHSRFAVIPERRKSSTIEFELVTWLVIV